MTPTMGETESATPTSDAGGTEPRFGDALTFADSYAFEITTHHQTGDVSGRYYRGDYYHDIQRPGFERVESYLVDGDSYVVTAGTCIVNPDATADPTADLEFGMVRRDTFQGHVDGNVSVRPSGTTTIDGEDVYVFEISAQGVESTYYVHAETGFLRRYEQQTPAGDVVVEFHSWGAVEPIQPPDVCSGTGSDDDETPDADDSDETPTTDDSEEIPPVGDVLELRDSYAFEITSHYQGLELSGRYHQGDVYHDIQQTGVGSVESYLVDGESYVITGGVCIHNPDAASDPTADLDVGMTDLETYRVAVEGDATVRSSGTTTIDGEDVYVFEIATGTVDATYYVSADTGFLRRYEQQTPTGDVSIRFHSWGEVDPIEPPDMTCLDQ